MPQVDSLLATLRDNNMRLSLDEMIGLSLGELPCCNRPLDDAPHLRCDRPRNHCGPCDVMVAIPVLSYDAKAPPPAAPSP